MTKIPDIVLEKIFILPLSSSNEVEEMLKAYKIMFGKELKEIKTDPVLEREFHKQCVFVSERLKNAPPQN